MGDVLGALIGHNVLELKQVGRQIPEAAVEEPGTDGLLVVGGSAPKLLAAILRVLAQETNQDKLAVQWEQASLQFSAGEAIACAKSCIAACTRMFSVL